MKPLATPPSSAFVKSNFGLIFFSLLLLYSALVYLPGISGPYLFDDYGNLLQNDLLRIQKLDLASLYHAAYSLQAGPLRRPIAMLSFALNYYFAGGFHSSIPFKLTNIAIHVGNGLFLFWLIRLIFARLARISVAEIHRTAFNAENCVWFAGMVALLWLVHPIQVTSVLYVVQRMTSLAALFTLLGLLFYFKGRMRILAARPGGCWLIFGGVPLCGLLGILSKESAALLPIFILVLEMALFSKEMPWRRWLELPFFLRRSLVLAGVLLSVASLAWAIYHVLPGYQSRPYTLVERVLTEARVLFFYISLILLPRVSQFGLHHDDIVISESLFLPWTTLPSILGIVTLITAAFVFRRRWPLLSLGLLWFFSAHLLESTIIPLEIAHEHRNYLASIGILLGTVHGIDRGCALLGRRWLWAASLLLILFSARTTYLRALQWSNERSLFAREALHHPGSAIAQYQFGIFLTKLGRYEEAERALKRAAELEPTEPSHYLWWQVLATRQGKEPDPIVQKKILELLANKPITPTTIAVFEHVAKCIQQACSKLDQPMEAWMRTVLNRDKGAVDKPFYYYLLGISLANQEKVAQAIESLRHSYDLDPRYLHPLFALTAVHVRLGQLPEAERVLALLREANKGHSHPRDAEIEAAERAIERLRGNATASTQRSK